MKMKMVNCEACEGTGSIQCSEDIMQYGEHSTRDWSEECEDCGGAGEIERPAPTTKEELFDDICEEYPSCTVIVEEALTRVVMHDHPSMEPKSSNTLRATVLGANSVVCAAFTCETLEEIPAKLRADKAERREKAIAALKEQAK